uniref:Uncharacterized protein n=1 Tax=Panagrolaimus davidi TaxID=227884 RepID=A0A914PWZ3_9BILA
MDTYCSSLKAQIKNRTCQCGFYSPSVKSNKEHKESKCCLEGELIPADFEEEETEAEAVVTNSNGDDLMPILSFDSVNNHSIRYLPN